MQAQLAQEVGPRASPSRAASRTAQLKTPVEGDSPQPDLIVQVETKVTEADREGGPQGRLRRRHGPLEPQGRLHVPGASRRPGNGSSSRTRSSLEKGKDKAVKGIKKKNVLEIRAKGDTIVGKVNGKTMTSYKDPAPEDVKGTGTGLAYGIKQKVKKKEAVAFFDKLKVQVPNP